MAILMTDFIRIRRGKFVRGDPNNISDAKEIAALLRGWGFTQLPSIQAPDDNHEFTTSSLWWC